jgi:RNA polymerase sigma factor (sigma-70 family)
MPMTGPTFDERFDALSVLAYRVAFRLLGNRADAEEVAQETLARAFARWRKVSAYDEPWVVRVATNVCIGRVRRHRPRVTFDETIDRPAPGGEALSVQRLELVEALRALPQRQREVLALRDLADMSEADVAAALQLSAGSVKQHAHRGLGRLRLDLTDLAPLAPELGDR